MKLTKLIAAAMATSLMVAAPAQAGWKLMTQEKAAKVGKGGLKVTPGEAWNRWSTRPVKEGEVWTLDGVALNELYFVSGLPAGKTLFRDIDKKNNPLPQLSSSMLMTDIPGFYESSVRIALKTPLFEMGRIEPATLGGKPGVKFAFQYSVPESSVLRKGVGRGAMVDGKLQLIVFVAPEVYYFDRDLPKAEKIMESATL